MAQGVEVNQLAKTMIVVTCYPLPALRLSDRVQARNIAVPATDSEALQIDSSVHSAPVPLTRHIRPAMKNQHHGRPW